MEAARNICFNYNPTTDLDTSLPMGDSTSSMSPLDSERNEDTIYLNDLPSDLHTLRQLGIGRHSY